MSSVNKVILVGNLTKAPVIRVTQSGGKIASFSLATNESWKDRQTGERREKAEFHRIVIFNDGLAGIVEKYVTKGSKVYVEGQIETRKWTDNSGADRYSTEIIVKGFGGQIVLLGGNDAPKGNYAQKDTADWDDAPSGGFDDEVPF